jgi:ABC-2 type transport system ATP-binding protein
MSLRLDHIYKNFAAKKAVDDLSLEVPKGVIYGIIGPNGAGKTTTIRMIMNIIGPDSGTIFYNDHPIQDGFTDYVGYLPEERGLPKKMTLQQVVTFMARLKSYPAGKIQEQMDPWLKRMGLLAYKTQKVEELSKGMAQKLQFITTVLHEPEIVILDELFSGLDPVNVELIKDILLELKRKGTTILFSTHVMEQAEKLCDYLCMINNGKKVIDGKLGDVRRQFGKNAVHLSFDGDGSFLRELPGVRDVTEFTNYFELQLAEGTNPAELLKRLVERVAVTRFELVEPSLYQIFIEMAKVDPAELVEKREASGV